LTLHRAHGTRPGAGTSAVSARWSGHRETYGYSQVSATAGGETSCSHQVGYREVIESIALTQGVTAGCRTGKPVLLECARSGLPRDLVGSNLQTSASFSTGASLWASWTWRARGDVKLGAEDFELMVTLGDHVSGACASQASHQVRAGENWLRSLATRPRRSVLRQRAGEVLQANRASSDRLADTGWRNGSAGTALSS
jgi:hypothetical protein